jgi:hypothetical protein
MPERGGSQGPVAIEAMFALDHWLPSPTTRVAHRRESMVAPETLWHASQSVRLCDASLLGRLVRWRIPGLAHDLPFDEMFRHDPFIVLSEEHELGLLSGMVGRLWTLRRDYPHLTEPEEFRDWSKSGTARVLFANWVEPLPDGGAALCSETRVEAIGTQGRIGMTTLRPLVRSFQQLIHSEGMALAVRRAEGHPDPDHEA